MKKFTKIALIVASFVLVAALSVGGTLAWLAAQTSVVTNTFVAGKIALELKEHNYTPDATGRENADGKLGTLSTEEVTSEADYQLIPGAFLPKDPFVRVKANSEDCYVFVEVVKTNNPDTYLTYSINTTNWVKMEGTGKNDGDLYYYVVDGNSIVEKATADNKLLSILANDQVYVKDDVANTEFASGSEPKLSFYAYAIQASNFATPAAAWTAANSQFNA